jgi:hypothetical protein
MSWSELQQGVPELAQFGQSRLDGRVAYLATITATGAPRVHPVTPILGGGRLFVFMEPTSPKGHDLRRDGRYALHAGVEDSEGGGGEFLVAGRARPLEDPADWAAAAGFASYAPARRYVLFELEVERAAATIYNAAGEPAGKPVRQRWRREEA